MDTRVLLQYFTRALRVLCFRELERARKEMEENEEMERMKMLQEEELLKAKKAKKKNGKDQTKKKVSPEVCLYIPVEAQNLKRVKPP